VNLQDVADDVLDLAAPLAKPGVTVHNRIGPATPLVRLIGWLAARAASWLCGCCCGGAACESV
jgi:hypothetical protein